MVAFCVEWAVAAQALPGERESGDLHAVVPTEHGVLVAAIDGLGHGPSAAVAAQAAADVLVTHPQEPPVELIRRCNEALRRTRGVVLSLAAFDAGRNEMTWIGVGNVEGVLFRSGRSRRESLLCRGGVVGYQLPPLRASTLPVGIGDTLIFATDGVRTAFSNQTPPRSHTPQAIADALLTGYAKGTDDALVLVARYAGMPP